MGSAAGGAKSRSLIRPRTGRGARRSGWAFLLEAVREMWDEAAAGRTPTLRQCQMTRLAAAKGG